MRRFVPALAILALFAVPALAQKPPPQQQQPQRPQRPPAQQQQQVSPQDGIAAPQGWRREVAQNGTIYFYCEGAGSCREGDIVSYRVQPPGPVFSLDIFQRQQERVNGAMRSERGFRNVEMSAPRDESHENTVVFVADLDLTDSNGGNSAMVSVYIALNQRHVTIVSTAPAIGAAGDNAAVFRAALISWLGGQPH